MRNAEKSRNQQKNNYSENNSQTLQFFVYYTFSDSLIFFSLQHTFLIPANFCKPIFLGFYLHINSVEVSSLLIALYFLSSHCLTKNLLLPCRHLSFLCPFFAPPPPICPLSLFSISHRSLRIQESFFKTLLFVLPSLFLLYVLVRIYYPFSLFLYFVPCCSFTYGQRFIVSFPSFLATCGHVSIQPHYHFLHFKYMYLLHPLLSFLSLYFPPPPSIQQNPITVTLLNNIILILISHLNYFSLAPIIAILLLSFWLSALYVILYVAVLNALLLFKKGTSNLLYVH